MPSIRWNRIPFRLWVSDVCFDSLEATVYSQRFPVWEPRTRGTDNRGGETPTQRMLPGEVPDSRERGWEGGWVLCHCRLWDSVSVQGGWTRWSLSRCEARSWVIDLWQNMEAFSTYETWVLTMCQTRCWASLRGDLIIPHNSPVGGSACPLVSQMSNLRLWECHSFYPRSHRQQVAE